MPKPKELIASLKKKNLTLALAESITGGYASYLLTTIAGSSAVFKGGIIVYALDTKNTFFNIKAATLTKTQGVSENIALTLAKKIRRRCKADIGGSLVGFAGPKARKGVSVGTVYLAVNFKNYSAVRKVTLSGSRDRIRKKAAQLLIATVHEALAML